MDPNQQSQTHRLLSKQWKFGHSQWPLPIYLVASKDGIQGVYWEQQTVDILASFADKHKAAEILEMGALQLSEYLSGKRQSFELPLDFKGTLFQEQVWTALQSIPYGTTLSYSAVAKNIGRPQAVRAVGSANGKNSIPIIIPCHRVIAADGSLGGYSGGTPIKLRLLELEQRSISRA